MASSTTRSWPRSRRCSSACVVPARDIVCSMGSLRATALALVVSTTIAQAQPKQPTQTQMQQAGELVKKAIARSQSGDHALAIELYQQAYNVAPNAVLLSNIGSEYEQAQKPI